MEDFYDDEINEPKEDKKIDKRLLLIVYVTMSLIIGGLFWYVNASNPEFEFDPNDEQFISTSDKIIDRIVDNMVVVEGGTVNFKSHGKDKSITVDSFSIGKYEVRIKEWIAVMRENSKGFREDWLNVPLTRVSYQECQLFCETLSKRTGIKFRMPTKDEWEFAARGGTKSCGYKYPGGNDYYEAARKPNELGLYHMCDNAAEMISPNRCFLGDYELIFWSPNESRKFSVSMRLVSTKNIKSEWEQRKELKSLIQQIQIDKSQILSQTEKDMVKVNGNEEIPSFSISKYEVTQELWIAVMGSNPSKFVGRKLPVESVNWKDCQDFIAKLNELTGKKYRLPTEREWEFAALSRNIEKLSYIRNMIDNLGWYNKNSGSRTHEVGLKKPNSLQLYDMWGNVREWCQDEGYYSKDNHMMCGGSWYDSIDGVLHSSSVECAGDFCGFRIVQ